MPSYYYHIKFELYPTPNPLSTSPGSATKPADAAQPSVWGDIFDDFLGHKRSAKPVRPALPSVTDHSRSVLKGQAAAYPKGSPSDATGGLQFRNRAASLPHPRPTSGIGPEKAAADWRFGRISTLSINGMASHSTSGETGEASKRGVEHAAAESKPAPAPSLGPLLPGAGSATRASLEIKNTELGWGIVHLYREGEETPGLADRRQVPRTSAQRSDSDPSVSGGQPEQAGQEEDCTTLCIPAVPSYLQPADFLGFMGDRWNEEVLHYRLVMTANMNRYMVLLKFRDGAKAKEWKKEFDGAEFSFMSVC